MSLSQLTQHLSRRVARMRFAPPVAHVYNPLQYARASIERYFERAGSGPKEALFLGMNPGPFGMAQTGVPFGDVAMVRDFVGVSAVVGKPKHEHPARPILGFDCTRSEVSGTRFWGWVRARHGTADAFFARYFVWNYCPLVFMEDTGRNHTPDKLPREERDKLYAACDDALRAVVDVLSPRTVIGVGRFAEERARQALAGRDLRFAMLPHPSPASPAANRGWEALADAAMSKVGA